MWPDVSRGGSVQSGFQVRIMKLQVHHPKLLAIFLLAIAAVTVVGVLFASGGDDKEITSTPVPVENPLPDDKEFTLNPIPVENPLPVVSDEELVEALRVAKSSGVIEKINGGQGWNHDFVYARRFDGFVAVAFHAIWETPVEGSGPWVLDRCKGTRELTVFARWTNITRLVIVVNVENDEMLAYAPMGHEGNEPVLEVGSHGDREAKVYDTASRDIVFEGTKDELSDFSMCPRGKEEEIGR